MMVLEKTRESLPLSRLLAAVVVGIGGSRSGDRRGSAANALRTEITLAEEPHPIHSA